MHHNLASHIASSKWGGASCRCHSLRLRCFSVFKLALTVAANTQQARMASAVSRAILCWWAAIVFLSHGTVGGTVTGVFTLKDVRVACSASSQVYIQSVLEPYGFINLRRANPIHREGLTCSLNRQLDQQPKQRTEKLWFHRKHECLPYWCLNLICIIHQNPPSKRFLYTKIFTQCSWEVGCSSGEWQSKLLSLWDSLLHKLQIKKYLWAL